MIVQSLEAIVSSAKSNAFIYSASLITTVKRRSCAEMGRKFSVSHDKLNRALNLKDGAIEDNKCGTKKSILDISLQILIPNLLYLLPPILHKEFLNIILLRSNLFIFLFKELRSHILPTINKQHGEPCIKVI